MYQDREQGSVMSGTSGYGQYYRPGLFGGLRFFPPVIRTLLLTNAALWLLVDVILGMFSFGGLPVGGGGGFLSFWFALWPLGTNFWPWQLLTYMFMHGGLFHLLFNMLALWMFGMELEHLWGSRRFLTYYLMCGVGAGLANLAVAPMLGQAAPTVGASGAVFGVMIAFAMLFPDRPIYVYFLLPVRAKYFIGAYIALELFYGISGTTDGIAHVAHLGGALVGFLYMLGARGGLPVAEIFARFRPRGIPRGPAPPGMRGAGEVREARFYDIRDAQSPADATDINQERVDEILDKISRSGYQSLSEEEKRVLHEASKHLN
jgi:membrane associated rhomboid family serine protease